MATIKQKNLAQITLNNPTLEKKQLVALGGYGPAVIKTPAKALESKGYLEELAKFGLTSELISTALVEDIKGKPKNRVGELRLGAEILQMKDDKQGNTYNQFNFFSKEQEERTARRILNDKTESRESPDRLSDSNQPEV